MKIKSVAGRLEFIFSQSIRRILFVVIVITLLSIIFYNVKNNNTINILNQIVTYITLGVALFVYFQQLIEKWEREYLPKRFTGKFYYDDKEVIRFENAFLTNEGDLRSLTQQIWKQMLNQQDMDFVAPEIEVIGPVLNKKEKYVHYTIVIRLTKLPEGINKDKILVWAEPFIDENGNPTKPIEKDRE